jgi:hypothetical protein
MHYSKQLLHAWGISIEGCKVSMDPIRLIIYISIT